MKKLFILIILITVILTATLFFLLKKTTDSSEVVFWTLQMSDFSPYINKVIKDFETQNPDIKIKWVDVPFSEGEKRTLASVLSDSPADLVNLNPDFASTLANKGALQEIPIEKMEQFNPQILKSQMNNGKLYSIPWYATSAITIYNKELFNKAQIPIVQTYEDISKHAIDLKEKTGSYIFLPNITENDTMLKILNKYGVQGAENIDSDEALKTFELFQNMYEKKLIPEETITITLQESLEKYMSGNIALITAGANFLNMIEENAPLIYSKTDIAPQIKGKLGQNDFSLMNFVIPLKAKHKDEALKFALFLTNEQNQLELAKLTNVLATNEKALKNEFYTKYNNGNLKEKARVISASQLDKVTPVYKSSRKQKELNNIINTAVQKILLNKDSTPQILKEVKKDWLLLEK